MSTDTVICVPDFVGNSDCTLDAVAKHFTSATLRHVPSIFGSMEVLGVNVVDMGASNAARLAFRSDLNGSVTGSVSGLVAVDSIRGAVASGKKARGVSSGDRYHFGDFTRGSIRALSETAKAGAAIRRGNSSSYQVGDFSTGASTSASTYVGENRERFGAAGGSSIGMAVGAVALGPIGLIAGSILGIMAGAKALTKNKNGMTATADNDSCIRQNAGGGEEATGMETSGAASMSTPQYRPPPNDPFAHCLQPQYGAIDPFAPVALSSTVVDVVAIRPVQPPADPCAPVRQTFLGVSDPFAPLDLPLADCVVASPAPALTSRSFRRGEGVVDTLRSADYSVHPPRAEASEPDPFASLPRATELTLCGAVVIPFAAAGYQETAPYYPCPQLREDPFASLPPISPPHRSTASPDPFELSSRSTTGSAEFSVVSVQSSRVSSVGYYPAATILRNIPVAPERTVIFPVPVPSLPENSGRTHDDDGQQAFPGYTVSDVPDHPMQPSPMLSVAGDHFQRHTTNAHLPAQHQAPMSTVARPNDGYCFGDLTRSVIAKGKKNGGRSASDSYKFGDFTRGFFGK